MQTQAITMTRHEARELYRGYKKHLHWSEPVDREIMRTYQLMAQGRVIIKALDSIVAAGLNEQGLPKLAICRADAMSCALQATDYGPDRGAAIMRHSSVAARRRCNSYDPIVSSAVISFPRGSFPFKSTPYRSEALVPGVPLHLRPKRAMQNYHILWEAEWTKIVPRDPMLLRRVGRGDLWVVLAAWDLTEVERTALAARLTQV